MKYLVLNNNDVSDLLNSKECHITHLTFSDLDGFKAILDVCFKPLHKNQLSILQGFIGYNSVCFEDKQCYHYERKGSLRRTANMFIMEIAAREKSNKGTDFPTVYYPIEADENGLFHNIRAEIIESAPYVPEDWVSCVRY